jgi:DNA repair exonuclease SbcCD nuclease subunit
VGLLHTSIESAKSAADHDRYAPSTRADYERLAYAYWALGHIHLRQQPLPGLPVHYAGNLLGRNPRETGAKGGLAVEAFAGASAEPRFVRFARVRWERVKLAVPPACRSLDELAAALARALAALPRDADERLALRLEFSGETPLAQRLRSPEERTQLADELAARSGALELQLRADGVASPLDRTRLRATPSVLADAFALIERAQADDALLAELAPAELALTPASEAERVAYLRELLADLPEELTLRGLEREGA